MLYIARRWLLYAVCVGILGSFGCGKKIVLLGPECKADLSILAQENNQKGRIGCMVFPRSQEILAIHYKPRSTSGGQFYYCTSKALSSCTVEWAGLESSGMNKETAILAFPPQARVQSAQNINDILHVCAGVFNTQAPEPIACENTGQIDAQQLKRCWFMFYFEFERNKGRGVCKRRTK